MRLSCEKEVLEVEKSLRIVWGTGEVREDGRPILRRQTIRVTTDATATDLSTAINALSALTKYALVSAQLVTSEQL